MKNKLILVILLCLLFVSSVNALTLNGTIGGSITSQKQWFGTEQGGVPSSYTKMFIKNMQYVAGSVAYVHFDAMSPARTMTGCDANSPPGYSTSFTGYLDSLNGAKIVSGAIGYQRYFDRYGTELPGYQYMVFNNDWNLTGVGKTGNHAIYLDYAGTQNNMYNCSYNYPVNGLGVIEDGGISFAPDNPAYDGTIAMSGTNLRTITDIAYANYVLTKPSGLGIQGSILKTVSGTTYLSQIFISDVNNTAFAGDNTVNGNDLTLNTLQPQVKISVLSPLGTFWNSSLLFSSTIPTPTPTQISSPYSISVNYTYPNYGEAITGTLLYNGVPADASNTKAVDWVYRDASLGQDTNGEYTNNIPYLEAGSDSKHLNYGWNGTRFVGWDTHGLAKGGEFDNDKGLTLPNTLDLYTFLAGEVTVQCMAYPVGGGAPSIVTKDITVMGTGSMFNLVIHARDWISGNAIAGSTISIQEKLGNTWSNVTTGDDGYRSVKYPSGTPLKIVASASGYVTDYLNYQVLGNDFINIQLYKVGAEETNISKSTLLVTTFQRNDLGQIQPLNGVTISLSDGQIKTSTAGAAQFTITNGTPISIDAFKTGYVGATKTVTPTSSLTTATLYLYSTSSTFVPTPFPTATPTIIPTQTLQGNLTSCQQTLPIGADVMDVMQNNIACWGIDDLEGQNFTMAALIILLCAMVLGKFGKGDGAAIGAIIGFIISYARHLIPFFVLIIAIALIAAYFAQKFFGSK
jgi:hypothetical protein